MKAFETKDYKAFSMFEDCWALVTAGTPEDFNTCTVSWVLIRAAMKIRWLILV